MFKSRFIYKAKHVSGIELTVLLLEEQIHNTSPDEMIHAYENRNGQLFYHCVRFSELSDFNRI